MWWPGPSVVVEHLTHARCLHVRPIIGTMHLHQTTSPAAQAGKENETVKKYKVAESPEMFEDAPEYVANSAQDAAIMDANKIDGFSDGFTSYVMGPSGDITEVKVDWIPGRWAVR